MIKVWVASTWSTKEQQVTILIVNLQLDFIYIFFFNLMDVACFNIFIVYNMMHQNNLTLLDYKTIVSTHFIGWYTSCSRASLEQKAQYHFESNNLPSNLPEFQNNHKRCKYCYKEGFGRGVFLCLVK